MEKTDQNKQLIAVSVKRGDDEEGTNVTLSIECEGKELFDALTSLVAAVGLAAARREGQKAPLTYLVNTNAQSYAKLLLMCTEEEVQACYEDSQLVGKMTGKGSDPIPLPGSKSFLKEATA